MATGTVVDVVMPQMGVSVSEGTITRWLKDVGDTVEADETLLEISTDKVDTEVPSPGSGVLSEIVVPEGETVAVGTVIGRIGGEGGAGSTSEAPPESAPQPAADEAAARGGDVRAEAGERAPEPAAPARAEAADAEPWQPAAQQPAPPQPATPQPQPEQPPQLPAPEHPAIQQPAIQKPAIQQPVIQEPVIQQPAEPAPVPRAPLVGNGHPGDGYPEDGHRFVSPVVARIAAEHGVDPTRIEGTGRGGRVTKKDILAFVESGSAALPKTPALPQTPAPPQAPEPAPPAPAAPPPPQAVEPVPPAPAAPPPPQAPAPPQAPEPVPPALAAPPPPQAPAPPQAAEPAPPAPPVPPAPAAPPPPPAPPAPPAELEPGEHVESMNAMRRGIAEHMRRSLDTAAHVTSAIEVDMSKVVAIREKLKPEYAEAYGVNPTYLAFVARATVETLRDWPWVNAELRGESIVTKNVVNLGFAVALEGGKGLIVPVVKHAEGLNLIGMARAIADVAERARTKRLTPDDVQGGTFTITNPGSFGTFHGTPIISQPQSAILGTYAVVKRPWVITDDAGKDAIAIRPMMNLTLTYDHRLVDGAYGAQFLAELREKLESWDEGAY